MQLASASLTPRFISLILFIYLVDELGRSLRPSGALKLVARLGRNVIKNVYPRLLSGSPGMLAEPQIIFGQVPRVTVLNQREGVILAFDIEGLVILARRADCVIEMLPQVGDFVAAHQPLFRIFGKGEMPREASLYQSVAVRPERTLQRDPVEKI